jgi:transposase
LPLAQAHGTAAQKKSLHAAERDTAENLIRRQEFLAAIAEVEPEHLVFLDESGLTTSMTRLYGRAPAGVRIQEATPESHWSVVTLIAGMRLTGMVAPMTISAATDGEIFRAYVEHFLVVALRPGDVVVMDNLSSHKVPGGRERIAAAGAKLLYLPPYSPDLNPIEKAWSKIKQILRAAKARSEQLLDQATAQALQLITPEDAKGWFRLCSTGL